MKPVLTIAGSDSVAGAGIQADLKTFAAHGCYGMNVITAVTAQNTLGVASIQEISPDIVSAQLNAVFSDIFPAAVKIGMVFSTSLIQVIISALEKWKPEHIVLDTVMLSTSGRRLLKEDAQRDFINSLIPFASLITPNIPEAQMLADTSITNRTDMITAAKKIAQTYSGYILIKGGHLSGNADDLLYYNGNILWFSSPRIKTANSHGTGCTLSSAIAANLAMGMSCDEAVAAAKKYLTGALADGLSLGMGNGPLNHFYQTFPSFTIK